MTGFKKVLALLVVLTLAVGPAGVFAFEFDWEIGVDIGADFTPDIREDEAATVNMRIIHALGGFGDRALNEVRPDDIVTRGEFIEMLVRSLDIESTGNTQYFTDVESYSPYFYSVQTAVRLSWISGFGGGEFSPNEFITQTGATVILVRALGARHMAEAAGGYPVGYFLAANRLDLRFRSNVSPDGNVTLAEASGYILRALTILHYETTGVSNEYTTFERRRTLLELYRDIHRTTGVVTATPFTRLTEAVTGISGHLEINENWYANTNSAWNAKIGQTVEYYAQVRYGHRTLIYLYSRHETVQIPAALIDSVRDRELHYLREPDARNTSRILLPNNLNVIWNGAAFLEYELEDLLIDSGRITFAQSAGSAVYDIAVVTAYDVMVVDSVDERDGRIAVKYSRPYIDLGGEHILYASISDINGNPIEISSLNEWDVIHVAANENNTVISVIALSESFDAVVTEITFQDDEPRISTLFGDFRVINEEELLRSLELGSEGTFFLDMDRRVVAFNASAISDGYAYLINVTSTGGIENTYRFRIMDSAGRIREVNANTRVTVDGYRTNGLPANLYANFNPQLVYIEFNQAGEIISIDTETTGTEEGVRNLNQMVDEEQLRFFAFGNNFQGAFIANDNTLVFVVPHALTEEGVYEAVTDDLTGYRVTDLSYFRDNIQEWISAYSRIPDALSPEVIVVQLRQRGVNYRSQLGIVTRVSQRLDSDGIIRAHISGYIGETPFSVLDGDDKVLLTEDVNIGDVIRFETNVHGRLSAVEILVSASAPNVVINPNIADYGHFFNAVAGYVFGRTANYVMLSSTPPTTSTGFDNLHFVFLSGVPVYIVRTLHDGTTQVEQSDITAINDFRSFAQPAFGFVHLRHARGMMFVAYQ